MGLKKRSKVSAQFSMSSLTDIIFLLLIFFMLTSTLVAPNALNLKLPGSGNPSTSSSSKAPEIDIRKNGTYLLDGKRISAKNIEEAIRRLKRGKSKLDIIIAPEKGAPVELVVTVMDIAMRNNVNTILAADVD